jgi:hypothetical protein
MNFGFELELLSPVSREMLARRMWGWERYRIDKSPVIGDCFWGIGWDSSLRAKTYHKVEMRSPVFTADNHDISPEAIERIIQVLRFLKQENCGVNNTCGLHVHVSDDNRLFDEEKANKFTEVNHDRLAKLPNPNRLKYCEIEKNYVTHYNWVSVKTANRLEFRLYNASMNVRHVLRAIRDSLGYFNLLTVPVNRRCSLQLEPHR